MTSERIVADSAEGQNLAWCCYGLRLRARCHLKCGLAGPAAPTSQGFGARWKVKKNIEEEVYGNPHQAELDISDLPLKAIARTESGKI